MENSSKAYKFDSLIISNGKPISSQDAKLHSCSSIQESNVFFDSIQSSSSANESSEQATGILMVSLPESSDEYQTPPEQNSCSQNSSTNCQVLATKVVAVGLKTKVKEQPQHEAFADTLSRVMKMLAESKRGIGGDDDDDDDEIDLIETAKKRGMTFPRPRWWPEEGFKN